MGPIAEDIEAEPPVHEKADTGKSIALPPLVKSPKEKVVRNDHRFTIKIQKSDSAQVGLEVARYHGISVLIKRVKDKGLVHQWNEEHPAQKVLAHDIIVEVNGIAGSSDNLLATIAKETTLECVIMRSSTFLPRTR